MSFNESAEISVSSREAKEKIDGKRVIESIDLEIADSVPSLQFNGTGRSDWFKGIEYQLSISQAEMLLESLKQQLDYLHGLEGDGQLVLKRSMGIRESTKCLK